MKVDLATALAVLLTANFLVFPTSTSALGLLCGCIFFGYSVLKLHFIKPTSEFIALTNEFAKARHEVERIKADHQNIVRLAEQVAEFQKSSINPKMYPASLLTRSQKG